MIFSGMRIASLACSAILLVSFALFVVDQATHGSKQTVATLASEDGAPSTTQSDGTAANNIDQANPSPSTERQREKRHGKVREAIDDADDALLSPFAGLVSSSSSIWAQRGVPTLIALLVFGVGLRFVAEWTRRGRPR